MGTREDDEDEEDCSPSSQPPNKSLETRLVSTSRQVDNMEGAIERFRAGGVHIICEPWTMPGGSKVAFVEAPDHVSVELIQSRAG